MYCGYKNNLDASRCVSSNGNDCFSFDNYCYPDDKDCNLIYYCKSVSDPNKIQYFQSKDKNFDCPSYYIGPFPLSDCDKNKKQIPKDYNPEPKDIGLGVLIDLNSVYIDEYNESRSSKDISMLRNFGCRK